MPLVKTEYGELKGAVCNGTENYIAFKGIPYAKPPLGELRFKAPQPPEPWTGVRDASKHGAVCPQFNERMNRIESGSEDCLYLNVYTKSIETQDPRPVMIWIHGGGFYTGSGNSDYYGPEFFMVHNVVLVTINYRLEVLGFLCLDTEEVPGNAGMKDQVLALKWVKNNIKAFGGDPNNITIFGCSAGSGSVGLHLISKMSHGLFNKAICQSGVCLNEWCYNLHGRQRAFQLGKLLGKDTDDPVDLLNFLRGQPVSTLIRIDLPRLENVKYNDLCDSIFFGPVVEKVGLNDERFLSDLPTELVLSGQIASVPLILGYTSGEGIEIARKLPNIQGYYARIGSVVPRELKLNWPGEKVQVIDEEIRKHYFDNKPITEDMYQELSDFETDNMFLYNMVRYARYHSRYVNEPVYFYKFVAETERNYTKKSFKMDFLKGVCHADDLPYLFNITCLDIPLTDESRNIIQQMVQLWVNFARTGVSRDMPLVKTEYGELKGAVCNGTENYIAFKGIPYAKPPLGELRFKAPQPPEPWTGVRDASKHGAVCPQFNERMNRIESGSEDCLYLNVYTKSIETQDPRPVMIWIHGGGFYTGSGNSDYYGPEFFMVHNVVLVTINYRLEVLGFLCLDTEEVPGNAGMKDQVLALKWVKNNIKAFGGDPNNITIFGCSAGSGSVGLHLISKMSHGLFNKAICQSGVCLNEWCYNLHGRQRAFQLGKLLGKDTDDPVDLLNFLRGQPVSTLIRIDLPRLENVKYNDLCDSIFFGPVVEKVGLNDERFLSDLPTELVLSGQIASVPLILGYTSGEGIEIARKLPNIQGYYARIGSVVPRELKLNWPGEKVQVIDEEIRKHYFDNKPITEDMYQELSDFETDNMFLYNMVRYARYHSRYVNEPVYFYKFVAETERNYTKKSFKMDFLKGVCHADDLPYLFNITCLDIPLTDESRNIIQQMVQLWVNFARTGKPTTNEEWKSFTDSERNYAVIGKKLELYQNPNADKMSFWENIYGESELNIHK